MNKESHVVFVGMARIALLFEATVLTAGCQLIVDPFTDELANRPAVTTPSVEAAQAVQVERTASRRPHAAVHVHAKDGTVTHGSLYFEDPFENAGSKDGLFAWTAEDYLYWVYGPGRFVVNSALFPISVFVTPPWLVMASDGHPNRSAPGIEQYDAEPWVEKTDVSPSAERSP